MTKDQRTVAIGAASGVVAMALVVWLLSRLVPVPAIEDTTAARMALALRWLVPPATMLFAMLAAIGNARFLGEAIDPTLGKEDHAMVVNGRVADNTLQQFVVFAAGIVALATVLPRQWLGIIPAVAITFVIARLVFWVGYRIHPLYRAPGFSSTAYLNLGILVATLWLWLR